MRITVDILLFLSALFLPWWLVLLCASGLFFLFDRFYELLAVALLMDLLHGTSLERFSEFQFVLSAAAVVLFLLLAFVKRRMRVW